MILKTSEIMAASECAEKYPAGKGMWFLSNREETLFNIAKAAECLREHPEDVKYG